MGSHFASIYVCDWKRVERQVGSHDTALAQSLVEAADDPLDPQVRAAVQELVDGTYRRVVRTGHEQGHLVIRAFESLCRRSCTAHTTVEMYEDEDETPLLYTFVWSGEDPLDLPLSPSGVPACTWHNRAETARYLAGFTRLRASGEYREDFLPPEELDSIVEILETAGAADTGVIVFYEQ